MPDPARGGAVDRVGPVLFVFAGLLLVVAGWWEFHFLCDDAFIEFRYASNLVLGHGLVWNPAPFTPVEGYTSFSWVVLLAGVWALTGVLPPTSAPLLSLGFSLGSLGFALHLLLARRARGGPWAWPIAVLTLLLVATNRTFLAWTSSGLETALFTFVTLGWVHSGLAGGSLPRLASWAALAALTRPDGLLFVALTGAWGLLRAHGRDRIVGLLPLLLPVAHVAWRRLTYGEWLPNTWFAKHVAPWPEMGLAWLAAFAWEYGLVVWLVAALGAGVAAFRRRKTTPPFGPAGRRTETRALVIGGVVLQAAYYVLVIGGDHFEFRIFQPHVVLLGLSLPVLAGTWLRPAATAALTTVALLLGSLVPWTHHALTRGATHYKQPESFIFPIADHLPAPLSWYARPWDRLQRHLLSHFVGIRVEGHRTYLAHQVGRFPTREVGERIPWTDIPVLAHTSVGYPSWTLPHVAIIDELGLNDRVIARTPKQGKTRRMAHDRAAPEGYVACFRPNVSVSGAVRPRVLTEDEVRACEARWAR